MNSEKIKKYLLKFGWIAAAASVIIFLIVALCVYINVPPNTEVELLPTDKTWSAEMTKLKEMPGDLEESPYVTKVYEYATDKESLDILWINARNVARTEIDHGIIEDNTAEHNYLAECFVCTNIADKDLIKRTWGIKVTEGDVFELAETNAPCFVLGREETDIKKAGFDSVRYFTFIRITTKPGYNDVTIQIKGNSDY